MASDKDNLDQVNLNIESFSRMICEAWNVSPHVLENYILANVSIAMVRSSEMRKDINKLYLLNKLKYYTAVKNSSCTNHVIISQGTLHQEIEGRKALGILLIAEKDYTLRNTVIKLLRKYYTVVFNAVKKYDKRELTKRYIQMDEVTRKMEARLDAAVYFYFGIYRTVERVDQGFFKSIIEDVKLFEFYDPMTSDISKELVIHKSEIRELKVMLKRDYGKITSYKDILNSQIDSIQELGGILENMFIINKLDINHLFSDSNFINIDEILLSYIKMGYKSIDSQFVLQTIVNGIFIKSLLKDYKKSRDLYFENNQETLLLKINSLEDNLNIIKEVNKDISAQLTISNKQNINFNEILNNKIYKLNESHSSQLIEMQNKINELEKQLTKEKTYTSELNSLREYIFKVNNDSIPSTSVKTLDDYIEDYKIIIIGGTKEWRRKFRVKYPQIRSLHGFNENFDSSILLSYDYVFFYSGFMNHATYYKAMSFIRTHNIKFGYIGNTNIALVEEELINELKKSMVK